MTPPAGAQAGDVATPPAGAKTLSGEEFVNLFGELGKSKAFHGIDSPEALGKKLISLEAMVEGKGMVKIPGADATPEEIAAFRAKIGVPEKPEGYEFKDPGYAAESGLTFNPELATWAQGVFHEAGVTKEGAQKIMKAWDEMQSRGVAMQRQALNETTELVSRELKEKYGQRAPEVFRNMSLAVRAIAGDSADEVEKFLEDPVYGSNRVVMGFLTKLGEFYASAVGEEKLKELRGGDKNGNLTVAEAEAKIAAVMQNKSHAYWNKSDPAHKAALEEIDKLYRIVTPNRMGNN